MLFGGKNNTKKAKNDIYIIVMPILVAFL